MSVHLTNERPARVWASGDLDLTGGDELEARVTPLLRPGARIEVDLHRVPFADSSGLGALIALNDRAHDQGAELVLVEPPFVITALLDMTMTTDLFTIRPAA